MAFYAPVALLALLVVWVSILLAGFTAMFWGLEHSSFLEAFAFAGSSLFTLGFASRARTSRPSRSRSSPPAPGSSCSRCSSRTSRACTPGSSGASAASSKLEVRAGQPPTGVYLIELAWTVGRLENLRDLWAEWEDWFTDVDESHSSFPSLVFFRSTHPEQSWITAAGAILDGASLYASTVDIPRVPEPDSMIRSGYLCLRHLAEFFFIEVGPDPRPDDPISIAREEFDEVYERLRTSGVPVRGTATSAGGTSPAGA